MAGALRQFSEDFPVFLGAAGRIDGPHRLLRAPFGVDVRGALFRIGGSRKDDVGALRAPVAVTSLIDDESRTEPREIALVGAQEIHEIHALSQNAVGVPAPLTP